MSFQQFQETSWILKLPIEFKIKLREELNGELISEMWKEVNDFECMKKFYLHLNIHLREARPTIRTLTLFKGIQVKYNIVTAREEIFVKKLRKAMDKLCETFAWLEPWFHKDNVDGNGSNEVDVKFQTLFADPMDYLSKNFEKSTADRAEMKSVFLKLKEEWDEMQGELIVVLEHCIGQVEKLIEENDNWRQRRRRVR
ncbi:unnamed protein product [Orchesella dallaii]|uniref:Uncharacterized protein n=1 Tax=Orchesella dallaii TaxID=48710 RepID=A0ABP1QP88_9HEXA